MDEGDALLWLVWVGWCVCVSVCWQAIVTLPSYDYITILSAACHNILDLVSSVGSHGSECGVGVDLL